MSHSSPHQAASPNAFISTLAKRAATRPGLLIALITLILGAFLLASPQGSNSERMGGDAGDYHNLAANLVERGVYSIRGTPPYGPSAFRTPGYPLFLAGLYTVFGQTPIVPRIVQIILHGLTAYFLFLITSRCLGRRAAGWAALQQLIYVPFLVYATYHLSESLSIFLTVVLVYLATRIQEPGETGRTPGGPIVLAGLVAGYLTLTRPALAPLTLIPLGALLTKAPGRTVRTRVLSVGLLLAATALVLAPWFGYTARVIGSPKPGLSGGLTLWTAGLQYSGQFSFKCLPADWDIYRRGVEEFEAAAEKQVDPKSPISPSIQSELIVEAASREEGGRLLRETGVPGILRRVPAGTYWLWSNGSSTGTPLLRRFAQVQWVAWVLLAAYGFLLMRRNRALTWALGYAVVYVTVAHLIFHIEPRYSFPVRALLFIPAGLALADLLARFHTRRQTPASADRTTTGRRMEDQALSVNP